MTIPPSTRRWTARSASRWAAIHTRLVDGDFHFYNFVGCGSANCISWINAYNEASSSGQDHLGMTGYLTTVTSDEENRFVSDRARANVGGVETWAAGWLGGRDDIEWQRLWSAQQHVPVHHRSGPW